MKILSKNFQIEIFNHQCTNILVVLVAVTVARGPPLNPLYLKQVFQIVLF